MVQRALLTSNTDEWETPQDLFEKLNGEFHFTLDVCANEQNHKCVRYYKKADDGLKTLWSGVVWCNPPYGRDVGKWVEKCSNYNGVAVMLLPARTDTKWFHEYIYKKAEIRFIKGRLKFGGSGSTLIACEQLGRKCYMMELDPKYCDVIRKRYWKFVTGSEEGWEDGTKEIS